MNKKLSNILLLDKAIIRLEAFLKETGSGEVPFLAESSDPKQFQLCDVLEIHAGASDLLRVVSRGGVPIAKVALNPPFKPDTGSTTAWLTLDEALSRLKSIRMVTHESVPVLMDGRKPWSLQPCDFQMRRHGVGKPYSCVSRGGLPVIVATFGAPAPQ